MPTKHDDRTAATALDTPLGLWIRAARLGQGLSQRELASRSSLSRSYVCDIERGRGAHPSMDTMDKLASALGFTRVDLMKASGLIEPVESQRETDEERRMLAVYRDLTDSGRLSVMRFARFVHADEHQWVQSAMLDNLDGAGKRDAVVDIHTRPMFDGTDSGG
jgi:transcriptional regulator with XRE-family HTH domain